MTKNNILSGTSIDIKAYWDTKYSENSTNWDIGSVSPPLKEYIDQINDKSMKILIPGAGNAYEAEYLFLKGFINVFVLDISTIAIESFKQRFPDFSEKQLLNQDFFSHNDTYDLIIEQTFFCAISPDDRANYVKKMHSLLKDNGKLVGVLFNHEFEKDGPPFGGSVKEYEDLFLPYFEFKTFEVSYNSIKPREKREHFINVKKKNNFPLSPYVYSV
ncbi:MAG: methyltransferase [Ignavibacteriae bacterium]|nr:methyltransferase [Ignavibacteriota bacterium]